MKNKFTLAMLVALILLIPLAASALGKDYIYRARANWVKLTKLSHKQMAGETLAHPASALSTARMEGMLLSLNLNKNSLFKKEFKTQEVFSIEEARKFAPFIVDALKRAGANQIVNVAIVHERSWFVMQRDYLSMMNVFVTDEGVHFYFSKLFAKLGSDYEQASKMDEAIQKAHSMRVSLEAGPGQKIAYTNSGEEVILDPGFDFASNVTRTVVAEDEYRPSKAEQNKARREEKKHRADAKQNQDEVATATDTTAATERLRQLEELKRQKLITAKEYERKRREILQGL